MQTAAADISSFTCVPAESGVLSLRLHGDWSAARALQEREALLSEIRKVPDLREVRLDGSALQDWDTSLLVLIRSLSAQLRQQNVRVDFSALPAGALRLLTLADAVPPRGNRHGAKPANFVVRVGSAALRLRKEAVAMISFFGETVLAFLRLLRGKSRLRTRDLFLLIEECGPQALPIVTLISVLVGLILAFIGAVQLSRFGAQIYVANLVGVAMAREMGAVMAGIILAGRTGAAYAAQLGTMEVNEEIDALKTLGIPVMDFLVVPRVVALSLMMPLLCLYADILGILGGTLIGMGALGISPALYISQTIEAVKLGDFAFGIGKSAVFGVLVALSGCMRGMQCGRSASAVGEAATSAVVTAIVLLVVTDAIFAVASNILGI